MFLPRCTMHVHVVVLLHVSSVVNSLVPYSLRASTSRRHGFKYKSHNDGVFATKETDAAELKKKQKYERILPTLNTRRSFVEQINTGLIALSTGIAANFGLSETASASTAVIASPPSASSLSWPLGKVAFSLLPLAGTFSRRATVEETIIPGKIWTHDQIQGLVNVNVPVRQTVIKLSEEAGGGLFVHNPVAPTPQLLKMMRKLEAEHGPVRHIVLGTVALEHKATFGPFARQFPKAEVWIHPGQWSFPIGLPIEFLGVTQRGPRLHELPNSETGEVSRDYQYYNQPKPEWTADIEYETLGPLIFKSVGAYAETAFFHKSTQTLLVTDSVVQVTQDPPPIVEEDPRSMLFHARDSISEIVQDTPEIRRKGWRRMVQFGLVFFPSQIDITPAIPALQQASKIDKSMKPLGDDALPLNLYPWTWHGDNDVKNFEVISGGGTLFCPPILTKLILDREPERTLEWVDRVASRFDFKRVIPCHLNNNLQATPKDFMEAFTVLSSSPGKVKKQRPLAEDLALLQTASDRLTDLGVVAPSQVCDGEEARRVGRFASK